MKKHPMSKVAKAMRYLSDRGWSVEAMHRACKDSGLGVVDLVDRLKGASA